MKVYLAEVWDSGREINIVIGVYSTQLKAQKAVHKYVEDHSFKPTLLDWDDYDDHSIEWFNSYPDDKSFTCTVSETIIDAAM